MKYVRFGSGYDPETLIWVEFIQKKIEKNFIQ
jgi:hypothetical protein